MPDFHFLDKRISQASDRSSIKFPSPFIANLTFYGYAQF
jgi:hypothetical protein